MSLYLPWNLALAPFYPALGLYTLHRRYIKKKSARSFAGQWGKISSEMRTFGAQSGPKFWIHAVSVGEMVAARPLITALKQEIPGIHIALSTTTDAGFDLAQVLLERGEVEVTFGFPLDLPLVIKRVLKALQPNGIGLVETELWPNLLHIARAQGRETFLLNGRVSDNLLRTAPKMGPLWRWMRGNISQFLMRGESDAERLRTLGVQESQILVSGDVKLETPSIDPTSARQMWRQRLGLDREQLIIAGSTHEGEEETILVAYSRLLRDHPTWKLALAPRHLERSQDVARIIEKGGFFVQKRTENRPMAPNTVFLLDSVGELADFYAASDVALVGGSWIERGGHNMLEPILRGVPVLFGPSVDNFRSAASFVLEHKLGAQCEAKELGSTIEKWIGQDWVQFYSHAREELGPHQGAATRAARAIRRKLGTKIETKANSS